MPKSSTKKKAKKKTIDFKKTAKKFRELAKSLGVKKSEIEDIVEGSKANAQKTKAILDATKKVGTAIGKLIDETPTSAAERERRLAELTEQIEFAEIERISERDFNKRRTIRRKITRLKGLRAEWTSLKVLMFGDLLDVDGENVRQLIEDANRDIESRQDLARVLKGIEVGLRVAGFGAAAAAKAAAAATGVPTPSIGASSGAAS